MILPLAVFLAATCLFGFTRIDAFAAEEPETEMAGSFDSSYEETSDSKETSEPESDTADATILDAQTKLDTDPVTLILSPGGEEQEEKIPVESYTVDEMPIPDGLENGTPENPATLTEATADENGNSVTKTTTALYGDDGDLIGYTVSVSKQEVSDPIFSEEGSEQVVTTTTSENSETWKLIEGEDGLYYLVTASMSDVMPGEANEKESVVTIQPSMIEEYLEYIKEQDAGDYYDDKMIGCIEDFAAEDLPEDAFDEFEYRYIGNYANSAVVLNLNDGSVTLAYLFQIVDQNNQMNYVYCADLATKTQLDAGYNIENVEDAAYYDANAAAHIKAIAEKGYWGYSKAQ
jgi:hypothetical protein